MSVAERKTKARKKRSEVAPVSPRDEAMLPLRQLDAAFEAIAPSAVFGNDVPELVRRNRRERAKRRIADALDARGAYPLTESLHVEMRDLISRWARKGFVDAFSEADEFEIRCAEERAILDAAAHGREQERFVAAERLYLREIEKNYGKFEIRGLQLSARVYQDLEIAYVPLFVDVALPETEVDKPIAAGDNDARASQAMAKMARHLGLGRSRIAAPRALGMHTRLLLVGAPGSGKSTLLAYFAARAARGRLAEDAGLSVHPIPFVIPVRSVHALPTDMPSLAHIAGAEAWFLERALRDNRACLFVDGLDEARPEIAGRLLHALEAIVQPFPNVRILVTSRPAGVSGGDVSAPAVYTRAELLSMTRDDVVRFIKQWCRAAELSLSKAPEEAEHDARVAADDLMQRVRASRAIEKLAQTPLLCSVICIVHRFLGQRIPERRVVLYDAITNVLLYEWDHAKFPEGAATGKLDAHAKRALLARLAREMHEKQMAEISADDLVASFAKQLPDLGFSADDAARIVAEIRDRNGVLVERSPGQFAFSHLTFQEYLAAFHIVNAREYVPLVRKYRKKWWHEVIVLAAGFPGANAELIVQRLLNADGDKVAMGTMLAAQCVETAIELPAPLRSEIEKRVATLVPPRTTEQFGALLEMGDVAAPVLFRALDKADVNGKASIVNLLSAMQYEPVIVAIGQALSNTMFVDMGVPLWLDAKTLSRNVTFAECAALAALDMLDGSDTAFASLLASMRTAVPEVKEVWKFFLGTDGPGHSKNRIQALIDEYDRTHPTEKPAPARKRVARSG